MNLGFLEATGLAPLPAFLTSLALGLLFGVVLLRPAWLSDVAGSRGLYAVALVSGLTDVDAITLSTLRLYDLGKLPAAEAAGAIVLALPSNIAFKPGLAFAVGAGLVAVFLPA